MKTIGKTIGLFVAICCITIACNKGIKKDFITGLSVTNNGLTFSDAMLVTPENTKATNNEVALGTKIGLGLEGVENFTESILTNTGAFQPWKRVGELPLTALIVHNENDNLSLGTQSTSPPKHKAKRRLGR